MSSLAAVREGYERFDPRAYLQNNYVPPRADFSSEDCVVPWKLRCLAETFASGKGVLGGYWGGAPQPWRGVGKLRHGSHHPTPLSPGFFPRARLPQPHVPKSLTRCGTPPR